ncbi:efflux RND transporter periplasmic adaptor subunit [Aestuariibius sp. HNIBRBA575]|uniref:efflux RND transporter periplasmic adaptor subunit n=1 Tax=Aestuariibius sp. HNIBRBA575 TaxID=3233343 RepID=UPI0034A1EB06
MKILPTLAVVFTFVHGPLLAQDSTDPVIRPVKTQMLEASELSFERQFFGQVVARQTVDFAFQVGGQIVDFPVLEGETVPRGGLIAQLDQETFQLSLDQARLQKEQADRTVARLGQLSGNSVSQVARDDAETQAALTAIAVRNAEYAIDHASLYAPFDALVATRNVPNFATISAGTPVVRLHDMSELRVDIDVPEILFQRAGREPNVEIWADFPVTDQLYPLEIREYNAESSAIGQTFRITFGMEPPKDLVVLPGSSVTVHVRIQGGPTGIIVPTSALAPQSDGTVMAFVFVEDANDQGHVEARKVTVSPTPDGQFAVQDGLNIGDEIIIAGVQLLSDGAIVRRFAGFAN